MKQACGFTLIETLIAIAVFAILATTAVPAYKRFIENTQTRTITHQLIRDLNYARITAIKTNSPILLCISKDGKSCRKTRNWSQKSVMIYRDINLDNAFDPEVDELLRLNDPFPKKSRTVLRVFQNKPYIKWLPKGTTNFQPGNLTYCPPSRKKDSAAHIIWNKAGRVYQAIDSNGDGFVEKANGRPVEC